MADYQGGGRGGRGGRGRDGGGGRGGGRGGGGRHVTSTCLCQIACVRVRGLCADDAYIDECWFVACFRWA